MHKTNQEFRAYDSPEQGFQGYVDFIKRNKRYNPVKGVSDPFVAASIMGKTGYATDPDYTQKLTSILKTVLKHK